MLHTSRYAIHPSQYRTFTTSQLRENFLIENIFVKDEISLVYTHYDRLIVGGANPVSKPVTLETIDSLKAEFFLQRREIGIINVGGKGTITVDGTSYTLENKEALYIGRGAKNVVFNPDQATRPLYYFNSAPAHTTYPTRKVSLDQAETVEIGSLETSNQRTIRKLLVNRTYRTENRQRMEHHASAYT